MVAYPTLVEDAEDDDDTTAFRRRVKDAIPVLTPSPAAAESKVRARLGAAWAGNA